MNIKDLEKPVDKMEEANALYKELNKVYNAVNRGNKVGRNDRCLCGSGKRFKKCCIVVHEELTENLEKLVKAYRDLCIEIRNKRKNDFNTKQKEHNPEDS